MVVMTREETEERTRRIAALTREGKSQEDIAAILGVTRRTVLRHRVRAGIAQPRPVPLTADQWERARRVIDDGGSFAEAARTAGCNLTVLHRRWPGQGWTNAQATAHAFLVRTSGVRL